MFSVYFTKIKQRFCKHVFRGIDLTGRNEDGNIQWPCSKCGKVFIEPYGIAVTTHGKITGPWH